MKNVVKPENAAGQRADQRALSEINDLIDDGVLDAASVLAWEVQRTCPGDPAVWLLLARIDYLRERYAAAIYASRMATRLAPASPDAWFALASTAATRPRWYAEGLDAALQTTALAPDRPKNWTVLAQLHLATGASYEAAVAAERAVQANPDYRGGHLMLGEIALGAGEWEHAETAFGRALTLDSTDRDARDGLVEALNAQGRDPNEELETLGIESTPSGEPLTQRLLGSSRSWFAGRMFARLQLRTAIIAIGGCLLAGLALGLVVPGLGVIRGLIGAIAVILMWIAISPTRVASRNTQLIADPLAPDAAEGEASVTATADPPAAVTANGQRPVDDATTAAVDQSAAVRDALPANDAVDDEAYHAPASDTDDVQAPDAVGPENHRAPHDESGAIGIELPDDPAELAALSRARLAVSDIEVAHAAASRLEAVAPESIEAHRALGAVSLAEHDYETARTHYRKVLELEPLDQEAHERLALVSNEAQRSGPRLPLRRFRGRS